MKMDEELLEIIEEEKADEMKEKKVEFILMDIWDQKYLDENGEVDEVKVVEAIREMKPSSILFHFCWSEKSKLLRTIKAQGIEAYLYLIQDKIQLTGRR